MVEQSCYGKCRNISKGQVYVACVSSFVGLGTASDQVVDQQLDHTGLNPIFIYIYACRNDVFSWLETYFVSRVVITALIIRHDREDLFFRTTVQLN